MKRVIKHARYIELLLTVPNKKFDSIGQKGIISECIKESKIMCKKVPIKEPIYIDEIE